ncbi:MAG: transposase [Caldilineaceae bacterium]
MKNQRRQYNGQFKFRVALEALGETKTINEIASHYEIHPTQVKQWKRQLREGEPAYLKTVTARRTVKPRSWKPNYTSKSAASRWNWSG